MPKGSMPVVKPKNLKELTLVEVKRKTFARKPPSICPLTKTKEATGKTNNGLVMDYGCSSKSVDLMSSFLSKPDV
ncbi:unnamed protein product [Amaranthus hypochondriacus]